LLDYSIQFHFPLSSDKYLFWNKNISQFHRKLTLRKCHFQRGVTSSWNNLSWSRRTEVLSYYSMEPRAFSYLVIHVDSSLVSHRRFRTCVRNANSSMYTCKCVTSVIPLTCYIVVFTRSLIRKCRKSVGLQLVNTTTSPSPCYLHQREDFPLVRRSGRVDDEATLLLAGRAVTLAMLSARKLWASGGIGIPDESGKTKVETADRAVSLSRSTVARRCLIKNVTSWELVREMSLFGRMSFYNLNFLSEKAKKRKKETFFLSIVKALGKQYNNLC